MNWKKETENELRDYGKKKEALINIPERLACIEHELSTLRKMDNPGEKDKEDKYLDNLIKKSELENNLMLIKRRISLVETGLDSMTDENRRLLDYFYMDRPDDYITRLCSELGYEKSSVYTRKDNALRLFALAMYRVDRS